MASDEPARDHHHSSEEEEAEAPSPGSPTDSRHGESVSSREECKARRDNLKEANKRSFNDEVENKEKTKRRAKSKKDKAETSKEGSAPPVSSMSHGSTVIACSEDGMVPLYRELDGQLVQAGWAPPSKKKPVLLAKNKNPVLSGPPPPLKSSNKRSFQDSNQFPSRSSLSMMRFLSMLRTSVTWCISMTATVMLKTGTVTLGQSARNRGSPTLPLRAWG